MTLYTELMKKCQEVPGAAALIQQDVTHSYEELLRNINRAASSLKKFNVEPADHVGFLCLNQVEYVEMLFATNKLGATAVPVNCMQTDAIIDYIIEDAKMKMLFISKELMPKVQPILQNIFDRKIIVVVIGSDLGELAHMHSYDEFLSLPEENTEIYNAPDAPAVLLYTSGTTGMPRGVLLTNENLISNVNGFCQVAHLPAFSKAILALPLFHSFGQIVLLVCILNHITTILISQFLPATLLKVLLSYKPEVLPLVPTMFNVLVGASEKKGIPLDFVKFCVTGGASIPLTLLEKLKETTDASIIEGYGLTETSPVISISNTFDCYKNESVGKALPDVEVKIDDDGEILVRGASITKGYWNNPEETSRCFTEDGYFRTGDIGYVDEEGFIFITDRKKDLIIRAGENISPKQIEDVLYKVHGVSDAAAFGVKDEKLGETIYCAVETEEQLDINELRRVCSQHLPNHLVPEQFMLMPQLPRNALGKILKYKLKEMFPVPVKS